MECGAIMQPIKTWFYADDPANSAIDFMINKHIGLVPVVDRDERFVGLISGDDIMRHMLPKHLTMVRGMKRMSYLRESQEELLGRLQDVANCPLNQIMNVRAEVVHPDSPLVKAQMILAGNQFVVPVVERENYKLLGAISFFSILSALRGEESWSERMATHPATH